MGGFKPHNRGNPCPVCYRTKTCKTSEETGMVFCHSHVNYDPNIAGWKFVGAASNGLWGRFVADTGQQESEFDRETRRIERQNRQQQKKSKLRKNALSRDDRDKALRNINKHVGLNQPDRDRLAKRGLTPAQMDKYLLTSKDKYQKIPKSPNNLPGVYQTGESLTGNYSGIICPGFDYQGRAIGHQTRRHGAKDGENKYPWAVSHHQGQKISSHLPNGELPITIIREATENTTTLWLCEGLLKPIVAGCRHKTDIAGCPNNGNFHNSPKQVEEILSIGYDTVIIAPDGGDIINPVVMARWYKQIEFFSALGVEVKIGWWAQITKQDGDIDEIDNLEEIQIISVEQFLELAKKFKDELWKSWIESQKFTPHKKFESKYVQHATPNSQTIFALKSDMGTGKTTALVDWIKEIEQDRGLISLGYRNGLLYQFCEKTQFDHIHEEQALSMLGYDRATIALCVDSLLKLQPEDFDRKAIIIDEASSVIRHLLLSATLNKNREKILWIFAEAIRRSDRVIMLDGNMTDWVVSYISGLAPNKQVLKIENTYKRNEGRTALFVNGTVTNEGKINKRNSSGIKQRILSAPKPFIATDSQIQAEVWDTLLTENGLDVLRVDSTTSHTDAAKEFLSDCDAYIEKYKPDAVIVTPSAESGVDVSIKNYFTHNFLIACGAIGTSALMQLGTRLRDKNAQMVIWAGTTRGVRDYSPEAIINRAIERIQEEGLIDLVGENLEAVKRAIRDCLLTNKKDLTNRLRTFLAFEKANLLETLQMSFAKNGWEIEDTADLNCTEINKLFKETKLSVQKERSAAIFNAKDIDPRTLNYNAKFNSTPDELYARAKAFIKRQLPGIEKKEGIWSEELIYLLKFKQPDLIDKINIRYLLQNPQIAKELNFKSFSKEFAKAGVIENMSLYNLRNRGELALTLHKTGIQTIIDAGSEKEWTGKDPEIIEVSKKISRSPAIRRDLGIKKIDRHCIKNANRALLHVGYQLKRTKNIWDYRTPDAKTKTSIEVYRLIPTNKDHLIDSALYECTETRWTDWLQNEFEYLAKQLENSEKKVSQIDVTQALQLSRLISLGRTMDLYKNNTLFSPRKLEIGNYITQIKQTISKLRRRIREKGFQNERRLLTNTIENLQDVLEVGFGILSEAGWQEFCDFIIGLGDFQAYQVLISMECFQNQ